MASGLSSYVLEVFVSVSKTPIANKTYSCTDDYVLVLTWVCSSPHPSPDRVMPEMLKFDID